MSQVSDSNNPENTFQFPSLDIFQSFVPVVKVSRAVEKGRSFEETEENKGLSPYIDHETSRKPVTAIYIRKRELPLMFFVYKGNKKSNDDTGFIETKLSIDDPNIKIIGKKKTKVKYIDEGSDDDLLDENVIEIKIDVDINEDREFYIDFYASDDDGSENNNYSIHCGRYKIIHEKCNCDNWALVSPIISPNKFIYLGYPDIVSECFFYALEQLRVVDYFPNSPSWHDWSTGPKSKLVMSSGIFQLYLEPDVAGMSSGVQKEGFRKGVDYLRQSIKNHIPVLVGIDYTSKNPNDDGTTDHFVTVVGMGTDNIGNYFTYYDNFSAHRWKGVDPENKLYCNCEELMIKRNDGDYRISQIRTSKRLISDKEKADAKTLTHVKTEELLE